jgi:hypothetical protein
MKKVSAAMVLVCGGTTEKGQGWVGDKYAAMRRLKLYSNKRVGRGYGRMT